MDQILSKNSRKILDYFARNPNSDLNINQISRFLGISVGSVHLILKDFEKKEIVTSKPIGNSIMYKLNFTNMEAQKLLEEIRMNEPKESLKKTKIVCTIGPSTSNVAKIRKMIEKGMNVARINASHCSEKEISKIIKIIRKADKFIPILLDIPGVKIRLNHLKKEVVFKKGDLIKFSSNKKEGSIPIDHHNLHKKISKDTHFLMDDGYVGFKVKKIHNDVIFCTATNGGVLKSRKGINLPGVNLGTEHLTVKDKNLIKCAIKNKINFIGISFIKNAKQVEKINEFVRGKEIKLISKIETKEAIEDYVAIIKKSYGIMIDRGDLGAEVGLEKIPRLQKKIIEECNYQGKPVIVATHMLESMKDFLYPTKSEITDVANAVLDGASALMLSAETAIGKYPIESVSMMSKIVSEIENDVLCKTFDENVNLDNFTDIISTAVAHITNKIKIDNIICITSGGFSARMIARHKLPTPIIATTNNPFTYSIMNLMWGVKPLLVDIDIDNSASVDQKKKIIIECLDKGMIRREDTIILIGAVFPNNRKITNMIEIHKVHEFLGYFRGGQKQ